MTMKVRPAAVAGLFYPAETATLERNVAALLAAAPAAGAAAKAIIAPHAGYPYSGPTAAHAYRLLESRRGQIRRVVMRSRHRLAMCPSTAMVLHWR